MTQKLSVDEFNKYLSKDKKGTYDAISPTAWTVAYRRTFSDIPYSKEIYDELEKNRIKNDAPDLPDEYKFLDMAPLFEARHKLINKLVLAQNYFQILDIASGLTPRGLEMTRNKDVKYVEVDLPEIIKQKRSIVQAILKKDNIPSRINLHLEIGNALSIKDLKKATKHFEKDKPIIIITEGLLRYFDFKEKTIVAKNVNALLKTFGGGWITPDIIYKRNLSPAFVANNERVSKLTGINIEVNKFSSVEAARTFFKNLGFKIQSHGFLEVLSDLVSPEKLKMSQNDVKEIIGPRIVFIMKL